MEGLKTVPYLFLAIAIAGVIGGAGAITVGKFGDTITKCTEATATYNETIDNCDNSSQHIIGNKTIEYQVILDSQEGNASIAEQLPTVAIIGIMVVIIAIIAGVFVYLRYFG